MAVCRGATPHGFWLTPSSGMRERMGRLKLRKLMGQNKDNLIGKAKVAHAAKGNQGIHLSPGQADGCSAIPRTAGLCHT